jgi:maltose alpha-D-glucosyltransferase/alpha-amylase
MVAHRGEAMADAAPGRQKFPDLRRSLPAQLPSYLARQRWFGGKARTIRSVEVTDILPMPVQGDEHGALLLIISVTYSQGDGESYALPMLRSTSTARSTVEDEGLKVDSSAPDGSVVLLDALKNEAFLTALLNLIQQETSVPGEAGELRGSKTSAYAHSGHPTSAGLKPKPVGAEQSNTSIIYGDRFILKFFRKVEEGLNPDLEIGAFLTEKAHYANTPQVAGALKYVRRDGKESAQGILQGFVPNQGDAWSYTLKSLEGFYGAVSRAPINGAARNEVKRTTFVASNAEDFLKSAALLGQRTAEMHVALASDPNDSAFAPEPFTMQFQNALEQSMRALSSRVFAQLREKISGLPLNQQDKAKRVSTQEAEVARRFQEALKDPIEATRTRIHGDYHLGQVLYTGSDFVIIDFEGEPARTLAERRIKRSPLQDVAGMLRSFHYAAFAPLLTAGERDSGGGKDIETFGAWAESWNASVADRFLASYFQTAGSAPYLPQSREQVRNLLELHLLEKAVYELGYELNNRPTWVGIPLEGIARLLSI